MNFNSSDDFNARCNAEAEANMRRFAAEATKSLNCGDSGMDYFHGICVVEGFDGRIFSIRDQAGKLHRKISEFWMGLKT